MKSEPTEAGRLEDLDDAALVERAQQRDGAALWLIIKRHNQRLYRVARAVLADETEAEDVVQRPTSTPSRISPTSVDARLSTWLTRIAMNDALHRRRQMRPASVVVMTFDEQGQADTLERKRRRRFGHASCGRRPP